jgi:hypothetical protein
MRIKYNLLWIEDEASWLKNARKIIETIVDDYGFNAEIVELKTEPDAIKFIAESNLQVYDLIIVDFKIGNHEVGNNFIENIRSHNVLTEVIFYSSNLQQIRDTIHQQQVEGVYCANRNTTQFVDKFEKVFKTTIKKTQDISSLRGLVLSECSQLDEMLFDIAKAFVAKHSNGLDEKLKKYIIDNQVKDWKKTSSKLEELLPTLSPMELISHEFIESNRKMRIVGQILEILDIKTLVSKADFSAKYTEDIIRPRNILAHCIEVEKGDKRILSTRQGDKEFDDLAHKKIRNDIREQAILLEKIKSFI